MPITIAQAITRITDQPEPVWSPGMTDAQKLQRINESLDNLYILGTWDGFLEEITVTTTNGVVALNPKYQTLEGLRDPEGRDVSIKTQTWKFSKSAPNIEDWNKWQGNPIAFDLGIQTGGANSGKRLYQIPGDPAVIDTKQYKAIARLKYVWATSTSTLVIPDSFEALLFAVRALHWRDVGDLQRYDLEIAKAADLLERTLNEIIGDEDMGVLALERDTSGGTILNLV